MTKDEASWPTGQPHAVVINIMYEQWAPGTAPGLGPVGNPLPGGVLDYQALSWSEYGPHTGIWRLLELLDRFNAQASVYPSGILAETAPASLRAIADSGHEICGHGWSQDVITPTLDEHSERRMIHRAADALEAATGQRPVGWVSPRCTPSDSTARLLAEAGFRWFGDVFDADLPYLIETAAGPIVGLPFDLDVNDLPLHIRYGQPHRELDAAFREALDAQRAENRKSQLDVTVHAHVAGRPAGRAALSRILEHLRRTEDCWLTTRARLAATV